MWLAIEGAIVMVRRASKSGSFLICFYLFIFLIVFLCANLGQGVGEKQPPQTETYASEQFKISFDYPDGCFHEDKKGFFENMRVVNISCSNNGNMEKAFVNLLSNNFMPGYDFKEAVGYILGFGHHADGVSESQYVSPFEFNEFANTVGIQGYKVTFSIVRETYTNEGTIINTTPRKAMVYDLYQKNETGLRAIIFKTSSAYLGNIADTFRIID